MVRIELNGQYEFFSNIEELINYLKYIPEMESLAEGIKSLVDLKIANIEYSDWE